MANVPYPTDTDANGVLITTEFGGPLVKSTANPQLYNIKSIYPGMYDPNFTPPTDESEGGVALQEQQWMEYVEDVDALDPDYVEGEDIGSEVVFENPLDTLGPPADASVPSDTTDTVVVADLPTDVGALEGSEFEEQGLAGTTAPESAGVTAPAPLTPGGFATQAGPTPTPVTESVATAPEAPAAASEEGEKPAVFVSGALLEPALGDVAPETPAASEAPSAPSEGTPELRADTTDNGEGA